MPWFKNASCHGKVILWNQPEFPQLMTLFHFVPGLLVLAFLCQSHILYIWNHKLLWIYETIQSSPILGNDLHCLADKPICYQAFFRLLLSRQLFVFLVLALDLQYVYLPLHHRLIRVNSGEDRLYLLSWHHPTFSPYVVPAISRWMLGLMSIFSEYVVRISCSHPT